MAGKGVRHRFELSRLEIVGVGVSAIAGLSVVFLLGMYAGRGLADRRGEGGERIVRLPVVSTVEQTPGAKDEMMFYEVLGNPGNGGKVEKPDREPRHAAAPLEEASVAESPPEQAKAKSPGPEPSAKSESQPVKALAPTKEEEPPKVAKVEPLGQAAAPAPAATKDALVVVGRSTAPTPRGPAKGNWSVQVSATRDPRTADSVLQRLRKRGYDAFVLKIRRGGETFYRVRVGHYASLEDAQQVVSRLRREPGVPEAFVASD